MKTPSKLRLQIVDDLRVGGAIFQINDAGRFDIAQQALDEVAYGDDV